MEPKDLLREARSRAGMTQSRLADAAHVRQPLISRIETGKEQPSMPTLRRLLAACGFDVALTLTRLSLPEDVSVGQHAITPAISEEEAELRAAMAQVFERR